MTADGSLNVGSVPAVVPTSVSTSEVAVGQSFDEVFRREQEAMVRMAYLLVGSQPLAEDAVQDGFARLFDRFDTVENPGGFVRTAVVNRCRDLLRRQKRERILLRRFRYRHEPSTSDHRYGDLTDVLSALDARRREVVVLRFYLGHSHREIATILGMREPTVRTTLHRALADLRAALGDDHS